MRRLGIGFLGLGGSILALSGLGYDLGSFEYRAGLRVPITLWFILVGIVLVGLGSPRKHAP